VKWDISDRWRQHSGIADRRHSLQHPWITAGASTPFAKAMSDSTSSQYDVPWFSHLSDSKRRSAVRFESDAAGPSRSSGIPSYYFKEHDDEGRSVIFGDDIRPSSVVRSLKRNDPLRASGGGYYIPSSGAANATGAAGRENTGHASDSSSSGSNHQVTRSLPVSAAASENGRRRTVLGAPSSTTSSSDANIASTAVGQVLQARRNNGDDGWDAV
jgi:hypothetical protein